jgi:acyl-CoA reductase-like NAD-dependent aldehyde dehydrogenase
MGEDLEPTSDSAVPAPIKFDFDYAPAPESTSIVSIADEYGLFIGGQFVDAQSEQMFTTLSPATAEPLAQISDASPADVDRAVAAARKAQTDVWGPMPGRERAKYLYRIARQLQERAREFAVLETMDGRGPHERAA